MICADQRWIGDHGIGRFARQVLAGLDYRPVGLTSHPAAPFDSLRLAFELKGLGHNDLFFSPGYNPPLYSSAPFVFTIHDLNHIDRSDNSGHLKRLYYASIMKRACHNALHVFTVSEFSRARIIEWSGVPEEKVANVRCGVGAEYSPLAAPYHLPFPYLLCVSNRNPHKNEIRTVEAFARARIPAELHLVFTGNPTPELASCIERNQVTSRVDFVGLVADSQMPSLYRSAEALVFVSMYEGFGLPAAEAMACGTPVLASSTTALPEITGDAALLVDPMSVEQITTGIERIATDTCLRGELSKKGPLQAGKFSWTSTITTVRRLLMQEAPSSARENC